MIAPSPLTAGGHLPVPATTRQSGPVPSAVLAMALFLMTEIMFFAGFISAYLVLRSSAPIWPPVGQPRLPVAITGLNTVFLLVSGWVLWRAIRRILHGEKPASLKPQLLGAMALATTFVAIQGYEWTQLVSHGLTITSSHYGGMFYVIVGAHAVHVLIALLVLGLQLRHLLKPAGAAIPPARLRALRMYWTFVVGLWPPLYLLVYLL